MEENKVDNEELIYRCYECKQVLDEDDKYKMYCNWCFMSKW